jgi:hypothetical protein
MSVRNIWVSLVNQVYGLLGLAHGGTNADLSGTGGTSQVLKQVTAGAAITVGQLAASDLSNGVTGTGAVVRASAPTIASLFSVTDFGATNDTSVVPLQIEVGADVTLGALTT